MSSCLARLRSACFFLAFPALLALMSGGCGSGKPRLNVFIWSEYIDPALVAAFEREAGCEVRLDYYEDNEGMMAKLAAGGTERYDIVVPSGDYVSALVKRGLLAPLRHTNLPNLKNVDPRFANLAFDPGNRYSVPYQWGATGLYLRRQPGKAPDLSWALLFDPARQPGPFLLMDDPRSCIGAALRYLGHSVNSTNLDALNAARQLLVNAKQRSLGFDGGLASRNRVLARNAAIAMTYNGDALRGMKEDPDTWFFVPREGSTLWLDNLCVPAKAPQRDLAERFINFLLEAKNGAQLAAFNSQATPNKAAFELLDPASRSNPAIYPPPEVMSQLEFDRDLGAATKLYDELWTQIKAR